MKKKEITNKNLASTVPNKMHLQVQINTRMQVIDNKKHYKRRPKHRSKIDY